MNSCANLSPFNKHLMNHNNNHSGTITSGNHLSYWTESVMPSEFSKLDQSMEVEVVVVGGGIAGLMTAYGLITRGRKVTVIEDGVIGSGETGRTTAHLTAALDDRYYILEKLFGKEDTRLAASSHQQAINYYQHIIEKENIECDFKRLDGYLFLHPSDKPEHLEKEFSAAASAGLEVEICEQVPGIADAGPGIIFRNQAQLHPLKFLNGLAEAIIRHGGKIFTNTHAKEISSKGIATPEGHIINSDFVVVATNSPVNNKVIMHMKQTNYRTYVIGLQIAKNSMQPALWWDTGDFDVNKDVPPYHYVRLQPLDDSFDLLIVGGEDHLVGLTEPGHTSESERYSTLETWAREHFNCGPVIYKWSGEVREPIDCLAYIGRNPMDEENVFIVTGDSGNGMTHGAIAGLMLPELMEKKDHPWRRIYAPSRLKLRAAGTLLKEFTNGFMQLLKSKPKGLKDATIADIPTDTAKVIELEGKKYGVYRDEQDQVHLVSVTCTHMGCTLSWNGDERSWDCPCHGSRFTHEGEVINGPANVNLAYHKEQLKEFIDHLNQQHDEIKSK